VNATSVFFLIGILLVTSCSADQEVFNPTSAGLSCPTSAPLYCPTSAAQAMPEITGWRISLAGMAHAILTFDKNDKVSMQTGGLTFTGHEGLMIDVVAKDNAYLDYIVWIETLDPGKTVDDLKKLTDPIHPPSWVHLIGAVATTPMSRTFYADATPIKPENGPIYFTLQVEGPGPRKYVDHLGPLEFYTP
jgi:hypothetical protein